MCSKGISAPRALLWAKTSVEKENQNIVPIWCCGGPLNSVLIRCSRTQTTKPVKMKAAPVVNQRSQLRGFKNIQKFFLSSSFTKTNIDTPDSEYGSVKSTNVERLATIVVSPTTASNSCNMITINDNKNKTLLLNKIEIKMFYTTANDLGQSLSIKKRELLPFNGAYSYRYLLPYNCVCVCVDISLLPSLGFVLNK